LSKRRSTGFARHEFLRAIFWLAILLFSTPNLAGELSKAQIEQFFPAPVMVGEKEKDLPLWPLFVRAAHVTTNMERDSRGIPIWPVSKPGDEALPGTLVGYAFESSDLAPVPGFSGKLINMLVALDTKGTFIDVRLISHREPIFAGAMADSLLSRFAAQYRNVSVKQNIRILTEAKELPRVGPEVALLQGVSRATVTVELLDKTVLKSALKVARAKFGIAAANNPDQANQLRTDLYQAADIDALTKSNLIQSVQFSNTQIEEAFRGTAAAGQDSQVLAKPQEAAIELKLALVSLPQIGRNLLGDDGFNYVKSLLKEGEHMLLIAGRGTYSFIGDDYVRAGAPGRLLMRQGDTGVELRDFIYDLKLNLPDGFDRSNARLLRVAGYAGIDPGKALEFDYLVRRVHGTFNKQRFEGKYGFSYQVPEAYIARPIPEEPNWKNAWSNRRLDLSILVVGLIILSAALFAQRRLVSSVPALRGFRAIFAVFTLFFIGWYGQGQLSIVNITSVIEALRLGNSLDFLLYDPMSLTLWGFVLLSLFIWGRGTFCGWLCPFGALQELISIITNKLGLKPRRLHTRVDAKLKWIKYVVLLALLGAALVSTEWTERGTEVEPFKTAISMSFVRSWPYVAWAIATIGLSVFVYRGYCRYICPLGAALAVLGHVRLFAWIPRRTECGTPCQTCRHRCEYQAIEPAGKVDYSECFQCLDCVAIHESDQLCAPRIIERKRHRVIAIAPELVLAKSLSRGSA
jgi:NosR/NirI family transcriptional regulator, nitrous oxide reductase regulator